MLRPKSIKSRRTIRGVVDAKARPLGTGSSNETWMLRLWEPSKATRLVVLFMYGYTSWTSTRQDTRVIKIAVLTGSETEQAVGTPRPRAHTSHVPHGIAHSGNKSKAIRLRTHKR